MWLTYLFLFELGMRSGWDLMNYQNMGTMYHNGDMIEWPGYFSVKAEFEFFDLAFVRGQVRNYALFSFETVNAYPFVIDYELGAGIRFGDFEVGTRHGCIHPIDCWNGNMNFPAWDFNDAYTEFYVSMEVKGGW